MNVLDENINEFQFITEENQRDRDREIKLRKKKTQNNLCYTGILILRVEQSGKKNSTKLFYLCIFARIVRLIHDIQQFLLI